MSQKTARWAFLALPALLIALGSWTLGAGWSPEEVAARFPDPDRDAVADDYVGPLDCEECHEDRLKSLGTSFHAKLTTREGPGGRACETCHGPGREHVDDAGDGPIRHPRKAKATEINGVCLRCHSEVLSGPVAGHPDWVGEGEHPRACVACHTIHVNRKDPAFSDGLGPFPDLAALEKHAEYVPAERCISCHPGFHPELSRSAHRELALTDRACGNCHGAGSLHAESGGDPDKILFPPRQRPADLNASCNRCHRAGEAVQRWTCAEHSREGVACIVCHDANGPVDRTLRAPQIDLCGSCHQEVKARLRLPNRHRVSEGRVQCTDCHDPHGNTAKVRDLDVRYRACVECHGEKGGPFLHDHGVKRSEGCVACHDPHGSPNRRMLTYSRVQPLCLQCHSETFHNLADGKYRNCIDCHLEIHGSDLDRLFRR